ncbi:hypothetical protein EV360DRAFT_89708 [Lentinula raphanica]|nr:hypothetical protein EV360DRAFT_89708 [Lentinula raphanica]
MAALYLHNAIFTPESSESHLQDDYSPHSRTISSTTLRTTTTDYSHPTEPLLHSTDSGSLAYQDLLSRQPSFPGEQNQQWDMSLSLGGHSSSSKERQDYREHTVRRKLRYLKQIRVVLKLVLAVWAVYNTVRYFIAFTVYDSLQGQTTAIVLGTSTAVCFAFLTCAAAVSAFQPYLIRAHVPIHSLLVMRSIFRYFAAFFLLTPTIVNLALVIVWRRSSISELVPELRCKLDADVVWSITAGSCSHTTPAQWLGLAIFRVIFTLSIVVSYLLASSAYDSIRRPSQSLQRRRRRRQRLRSDQTMPKSPPTSASSDVPLNPRSLSRQSSHTRATLKKQRSRAADPSYRSSEASSMLNSSSSEDDESIDPSRIPLSPAPAPAYSPTLQTDRELTHFADRFRALVAQITRETDDALRYAQSDAPDTLTEPGLHPDNVYTDLPRPTHAEFIPNIEFPPDDHVRILNGFVRRMPTIESLGSRELTSLASSRDRVHSLSRPPTRSVTEFTGSEPPSRANSLSLTAAIGGHGLTSTEMGELMDQIDKENSMGTGSGSQSASRSTFSYYTAPSIGRASDSPVPLTPGSDHFPSSPISGHSHSS